MEIKDAIKLLKRTVPDPNVGLPDDIFYYISETTPLVNVDLLIKDEKQRTLLAWRDDPYAGVGWHIPGGIIRFKETFKERINKVVETEIGTPVDCDYIPIAVNEIMNPHVDVRGHFVSILYRCFLSGEFTPENKNLDLNHPGFLKWHDGCPNDLLKFHEVYRKYL